MPEGERIAALRLIRSENVGPVTYRELLKHYGSATAALAALPELSQRGGRRIRVCGRDEAEAELDSARQNGAHLLLLGEPAYPAPLAALDVPPPLLYAKGDTGLLQRPTIAIVGARQCSAAGAKLARCSPTRSHAPALSSPRGWRAASTPWRIRPHSTRAPSQCWPAVSTISIRPSTPSCSA
jgi:predicted Rossmann fold nucleotide-binding protein DprA/Smf involved in DNA uptake